jgi:hypothetical protein
VTDPTKSKRAKYRRLPRPTAKAIPRNEANQKNPKDEFQTGSINGVGDVIARSAITREKTTDPHMPAVRHRTSIATDRMIAHRMAEPMRTP